MSKVGPLYPSTDFMQSSAVRDVSSGGIGAKAMVVIAEQLQVAIMDHSGEIATGGTAQPLMPVNEERQGWLIQNYSASPLYISALGSATADGDSLMIPGVVGAGYSADFINGEELSIMGPVTGQKFFAREW